MATFAVYTHVGDEKPVHVNLDTVQMIEPYLKGALIKFADGAALNVRETPEQVARATNRLAQAADRAVQPPDRVAPAPVQVAPTPAKLAPPPDRVAPAPAPVQVAPAPAKLAPPANSSDKRQGSFKINLATGKWADFETGDGGSDVASLAAYIQTLSQFDAARLVAAITGLPLNSAVANEPTSHRSPHDGLEHCASAVPERGLEKVRR